MGVVCHWGDQTDCGGTAKPLHTLQVDKNYHGYNDYDYDYDHDYNDYHDYDDQNDHEHHFIYCKATSHIACDKTLSSSL